jgi:hypothetical protein
MHRLNMDTSWYGKESVKNLTNENPTRATSQEFWVSVCMSMLHFLQMRKAMIDQEYGNKSLLLKYHFDHMVSKCM